MRNRSLGKWKLPQPTDLKADDDREWLPIPRIARIVPFGYKQDPNDTYLLLPIKEELDLLERARQLVKQYSYREVAQWLTQNTGRTISHVGLMKRIKNEQNRKNKTSILRYWANYAEKAIQKAYQIEEGRTGAKVDKPEEKADCISTG